MNSSYRLYSMLFGTWDRLKTLLPKAQDASKALVIHIMLYQEWAKSKYGMNGIFFLGRYFTSSSDLLNTPLKINDRNISMEVWFRSYKKMGDL